MQVAEDAGDHLATFDHFAVDVTTGKVVGAEFEEIQAASPASAGPGTPEPGDTATAPPLEAPRERHESRTGEWLVFPGRTPAVASPDGRLEAWVEGWTTLPGTSVPVTRLATDADLERLQFWARLAVAPPGGKQPSRLLTKVGPPGAARGYRFHDLRIVAWSPDSRAILSEYAHGAPLSDERLSSVLLVGIDGKQVLLRDEHVRRLCHQQGLRLDPKWHWQMDLQGFTLEGQVLVAFDEIEDEGAASRTGPRVFAVDPAARKARVLERAPKR